LGRIKVIEEDTKSLASRGDVYLHSSGRLGGKVKMLLKKGLEGRDYNEDEFSYEVDQLYCKDFYCVPCE
jgi:hypothetical protein